jgi:hypothetical protein
MVLIQDLAAPLFRDIITWTILILWLLLFVKLVQVFGSLGGLGSFGGKKNKEPKDKKEEKIDEPDDDKEDIKKNTNNYEKIGLDPNKSGKMLFCAMDKDNNPLMGVRIYVWPLNRNLWKRITHKEYRNKYFGETGANGFLPEPHYLPAGEWKIQGVKLFWKQKQIFSFKSARHYNKKRSKDQNFEVAPDSKEYDKKSPQVKGVIMHRSIEDSFAPLILNYDEFVDKKGKKQIKLNGIIH